MCTPPPPHLPADSAVSENWHQLLSQSELEMNWPHYSVTLYLDIYGFIDDGDSDDDGNKKNKY